VVICNFEHQAQNLRSVIFAPLPPSATPQAPWCPTSFRFIPSLTFRAFFPDPEAQHKRKRRTLRINVSASPKCSAPRTLGPCATPVISPAPSPPPRNRIHLSPSLPTPKKIQSRTFHSSRTPGTKLPLGNSPRFRRNALRKLRGIRRRLLHSLRSSFEPSFRFQSAAPTQAPHVAHQCRCKPVRFSLAHAWPLRHSGHKYGTKPAPQKPLPSFTITTNPKEKEETRVRAMNETDKKGNSSAGPFQGQALRVFEKISTLVPRVVFFQKTLTKPVFVH
jgi:hypothetical protein